MVAGNHVDCSLLTEGTKLQVEAADGVYYAASVVTVSSTKKRANAPVKVHYLGYDVEWDEWVSATRIRSKALKVAGEKRDPQKKEAKGDVEKICKPETQVASASVAPEKEKQPARVVGFDFDCTLTVRHFYKVLAWGYTGAMEVTGAVAKHFEDFVAWCEEHDLETCMQSSSRRQDVMSAALEHFCAQASAQDFRELFREIFLGGEERIALITKWLQRMRDEENCSFAIVTAGVALTVLRALASAVPEWLPFFPSDRIWDCEQGRHASAPNRMAQKALILRDVCKEAPKILLVDDTASREPVPEWLLKGTNVEVFKGALEYEGPGVSSALLAEIEQAILA